MAQPTYETYLLRTWLPQVTMAVDERTLVERYRVMPSAEF